jgi:hypothetical protein
VALQFAGRLAVIGFATTLLAGAIARSGVEGAVQSALVAGAAFYAVGLVLGEFARRIAELGARAEFERQTAPFAPQSERPV